MCFQARREGDSATSSQGGSGRWSPIKTTFQLSTGWSWRGTSGLHYSWHWTLDTRLSKIFIPIRTYSDIFSTWLKHSNKFFWLWILSFVKPIVCWQALIFCVHRAVKNGLKKLTRRSYHRRRSTRGVNFDPSSWNKSWPGWRQKDGRFFALVVAFVQAPQRMWVYGLATNTFYLPGCFVC